MAFDPHENLDWLAGLFEGEGWVSVDRGAGRRVNLGIAMTDLDVLQAAQRTAGVGRIYGPYGTGRVKPIWQWRVHRSEEVAGLAMTLYPMLAARRREQIRNMLTSWRLQPTPSRLKTHCIHGHPLSGENLCSWDKRARRCRACNNERTKRDKLRRRAAGLPH